MFDHAVLLRRVGRKELLTQTPAFAGCPKVAKLHDQSVVAAQGWRGLLGSQRARAIDTGALHNPFGLLGPISQGELEAHGFAIMAIDHSGQVPPSRPSRREKSDVHDPTLVDASCLPSEPACSRPPGLRPLLPEPALHFRIRSTASFATTIPCSRRSNAHRRRYPTLGCPAMSRRMRSVRGRRHTSGAEVQQLTVATSSRRVLDTPAVRMLWACSASPVRCFPRKRAESGGLLADLERHHELADPALEPLDLLVLSCLFIFPPSALSVVSGYQNAVLPLPDLGDREPVLARRFLAPALTAHYPEDKPGSPLSGPGLVVARQLAKCPVISVRFVDLSSHKAEQDRSPQPPGWPRPQRSLG